MGKEILTTRSQNVKNKMATKKQNGRQINKIEHNFLSYKPEISLGSRSRPPAAIYEQITKVLITQPFFEVQTPDFAWKFIWIVEPNDKVQKTTQKSTKIQKRKNAKKCKKHKKYKIQK